MALSLKNPSHKKGENEHKKKQFLKIEKSFKLLKNCIKFHKGPKSSVFLFSGFDQQLYFGFWSFWRFFKFRILP